MRLEGIWVDLGSICPEGQVRNSYVYQDELAKIYNNLGVMHAGKGRMDQALKSYERAVAIREGLILEHPTMSVLKEGIATSRYNIACSLALKAAATTDAVIRAGFAEKAIEALRQAGKMGFADWKNAESDPDFKILQERADFQDLIRSKLKPKQVEDK